MVEEPSHVQQLYLNHVCKIGLKKTVLFSFSCLKNPYKKSAKKENFDATPEWNGKMRVENQKKKLESEKTLIYAQKPRLKNAVQEFHLRMG
jgi:hypothetical protein